MNTKHTLGKLKYAAVFEENSPTQFGIFAPPENPLNFNGKLIAKTIGCEPEDEANARLIAAAPDLYEALKSMVSCQADDGTKCTPNDADFEKARAAIAKAEMTTQQ